MNSTNNQQTFFTKLPDAYIAREEIFYKIPYGPLAMIFLNFLQKNHPEFNFDNPICNPQGAIKECGRTLKAIMLSCKHIYNKELMHKVNFTFKEACQFHEKYNNKYPAYGSQPMSYSTKPILCYNLNTDSMEKLYDYPGGPSWLLDALFTGCDLPGAKHTYSTWNEDIENDVKTIVEKCPIALKCTQGQLGLRWYITPIAAAIYNIKIPVEMIGWLYKNGAEVRTKIFYGGLDKYWIEVLVESRCEASKDELDRLNKIPELLKKK